MSELDILQHALGVDEFGRGSQYRRHFVTGLGSTDHPACLALVEQGLMVRRAGNPLTGGDDLFLVTDAGRRYVAGHSPPPPRLTRGQQRYRDYLEADSGLSFGKWLKRIGSSPLPLAGGAGGGLPAFTTHSDLDAEEIPF